MSTTSGSEDWSSDDDSPLSSSYDFNPFSRARVRDSSLPSPTPRRRPTARSSTNAPIEGIVPFRYLPSPAEREAVLQKIQEREENDKNLSDQIEVAEEALLRAEEAKLENMRQIGALKWSISALARLPDEIFGAIFELCVLELGQSPWILAKVSSTFRRTAFATRKIWARIELDKEPSRRPGPRYSHGRERCLNVSQLQAALLRSGKASLDIDIVYCTPEMAHILADEGERWESVRMGRLSKKSKTVLLPILFGAPKEASRLQSAKLSGLSDSSLRKWLASTKPKSLELVCHVKSIAKVTWWSELRRLRLNHLEYDDAASYSRILYSAFTSIGPFLTYLEVDEFEGGEEGLQGSITFPELLELKLVGVTYWWQFQCDKLLKMSIQPSHAPPPGTVVSYPNLLELNYTADCQNLESGVIIAPNLDLLILREAHSGTNSVWIHNDGTPSGLTPKRLHLRSYTAPIKPLLDSLRAYPALEELHINHCNFRISFFKALSVRPSKNYPMLCPGLRRMEVLLSYGCVKDDRERFKEVFEATISMRKRYNQPLSKLLITWPSFGTEDTVQEFVTDK